MKKRSKSIVVSLLMALAFGAMSVGTTFALFTSQAKTSIEVGTGKLNLTSSASGLKTYSCVGDASGDRLDELGNKYKSQLTTVQGVFTNGGTAGLSEDGNELELERVTPGDRVAFNVNLGVGQTNIDFKYRVNFKYVGEDKTLAKGLVTTFAIGQETPETFKGLLSYTSQWKTGTPTSTLPSLAFDIELPIDKGNEYQEKNGGYLLTIQAVQGNAVTDDTDAYVSLISEDIVSPTVTADEQDTTVTASDTENNVSVTTTIPAAAPEVGNGDKVHLVVSDLAVSELPESHTGTMEFDATLYVNDVVTSSFSQPVTVTIQLHQFLNIQSVKHNGSPISGYEYNANTGVLTFTTTSFSPFSVEYEKMAHNTMYHFYDSYVENGHWVHEVTDKATFKNIMAHISARGAQEAADTFNGGTVAYPLADKTTVYLLKNNINFGGGNLWNSGDAVYSNRFTGKLIANEQVTLSNIQATTGVTNSIAKDGDTVVVALFGAAKDAYFENITLSSITINNPSAEYSGLFVQGNNTGPNDFGGDITFKNCIAESDCSIAINKSGHIFLPLPRFYKTINFDGCVNKASVTNQGYGASAFLGNGTSGSAAITFTNCANYGNMTGTYLVSGFNAYTTSNNHSITMTNCFNYGNINVTEEDGYHGSFFLTTNSSGWYTSVSMTNVINYGKMYVKTSSGQLDSTKYSNNKEYEHLEGTNPVVFKDTNGTTITKANYFSLFVEVSNVDELALNFDENDNYKLKSSAHANVHHVVVTLTAHNLRLSRETGEEWPTLMGGESGYVKSMTYDSLEEIDVMRISQVGYYIPSGAHAPVSPINYGFDRYLLDGPVQLTDGYHAREGGNSYFVITNAEESNVYFAICVWRNRIEYTVTAFDANNNIIARGQTQYGWDNASSGYDSLLTAITL